MPNIKAIVGNPPYHLPIKSNPSKVRAFHHIIISSCLKLEATYLSMIVPARFLRSTSQNKVLLELTASNHVSTIKTFQDSSLVFDDVYLIGGVMYFMYDKYYNDKCKLNENYLDITKYDTVFDLPVQYDIVERTRTTNSIHDLIQPWFHLHMKDFIEDINGIKMYTNRNKVHYQHRSHFKDTNDNSNKWKCCVPYSSMPFDHSDEDQHEVFSEFLIAEPDSIVSEHYIIISAFDDKCKSLNFMSYIKTKFFRYLASLKFTSMHVCNQTFSFIPDVLDYTKPWTDKELYKMFNLSQEEIAHIESTIKQLEV